MEDDSDNPEDENVTITFGEEEKITCSKCLLMKKSDYFNAMFSSGMKESHYNVVEIKDMEADVMRELIRYISSEVLHLTNESVYCITAGACRFQISSAIELCCEFLSDNLCHNTCSSTLECSTLYHLKGVLKLAKRHMQHYFTKVCQTEDFLSIQVATLKSLLLEKALNVESEIDVYYAFERWIDADVENRQQYIKELSKYIHIEDIINPSIELNMLSEFKYLHISKNGILQRLENNKDQIRRKYRQVPEDLFCVGLQRFDEASQSFWFDPVIYKIDMTKECSILKDNVIATMEEVLPNVEGHGGYSVCVNGQDIIVSGGEPKLGKNTWNLGIYCYNTFTNKWRKLSDLQSPRRHHASCAINNCLYVIGGYGRFRVKLSSMEKYDCDEDKWCSLAQSPTHGYHKALTVLHNKIYALFCSSAMFCYSPVQDSWTKLLMSSDIQSGLAFLGACTYNDAIYVRASRDLVHVLQHSDDKSLEVTNTYTHFTKKNNEEIGGYVFGITICNDIMYCFKTDDETGFTTDLLYVNLLDGAKENGNSKVVDVQILMQHQLDLVTVPVY